MKVISLSKVLIPFKFKFFYREMKSTQFNLLDIGCGNHSPSLSNYWFPHCNYYGLDKGSYNNEAYDVECMKQFFQIDLESSALSEIPDRFFEIIIFSHVIEHLLDGLPVLEKLTHKLSDGGKIYIEFPSVRSLSLPSAIGTLHFCDDESHKRLYDLKEIANTLLSNNLRIISAGVRRDWRKIILVPLMTPVHIYSLLRYGKLWGGLWDLLGFANYVYAERLEE